jgi:hypothetical protein
MNGGSMTTFSRISMAAVAALIVGMGPASAADLGGNCCADLEERVAELEATTARKGNRKVSLTISGQISTQLMFWDDGVQSDVYVNGPGSSNSRWRMSGSAKISPEVSAGFLYEFEAFGSSNAVNQTNGAGAGIAPGGGDDNGSSGHNLREALAWVEHSRLGRVTMGHGSTAANNAILVDLSGKGMAASNDVTLHNSGFLINNGTGLGGYSTATWANFFNVSGGTWLNPRMEHIQYRTPTIAGFTLGASFGEDNYWDVALRYAGEFNGIRIAGALGYSVNSEFNGVAGAIICTTQCRRDIEQLAGSLSIRHMPTGLFFTGAAGTRDVNNADGNAQFTAGSYDANFYYLSAGIARNFFGIGDTVIYGEYSVWEGNAQELLGRDFDGTSLDHWGVGVVQHVDAAAMEFWLAYKNHAISGAPDRTVAGINFRDAEDLHVITAGTRIRF